jgi:putative redox protein
MNNPKSRTVLSNKNYLTESKMRNHFTIIDEPVELGGGNIAPTPIEYFLTAIGSCVAITLRMYAERKEWNLGKITVDISQKTETTDDGIVKSLVEDIAFENEATEAQRKRLLNIAGKCPVVKMVKGNTLIETSIN